MGVSSKLLLDVTGAQTSELDSSFSLNDRGTHTHTVYEDHNDVMIFILYKLYILSPKPNHYRELLAFLKSYLVCFSSDLVYKESGSVPINHVYIVIHVITHLCACKPQVHTHVFGPLL